MKVTVLALVLSFGLSYVYAWTAPTISAPGGNVSAPINTSTVDQVKGSAKTGGLGVEGLIRGYSNAIFDGNVGVGTTAPWAKLHEAGAINQPMALFSGKDLRTNAFAPGNPDPSNYIFLQNENSSIQATWGLRVGASGEFGIHLASVGDKLTISNSGNVGIGTTAPSASYKLDVNGKIRATNGVLLSGSTSVQTGSREVGYATVDISSLGLTDANYQVSLTAKPSDGGIAPDNHGPLYVPFVYNKTTTSFGILVYDIQANAFNVTIPVDWVVVKN